MSSVICHVSIESIKICEATVHRARAGPAGPCAVAACTRIKPSVKSPKSGILVTEVMTFDKIAPWVILGRS